MGFSWQFHIHFVGAEIAGQSRQWRSDIPYLGVAGADDVGACELGGEADEEAAERLIAVEAAVVGPHALAAPRAGG